MQKKTPDILLCNSKEGVEVSFDKAVLQVNYFQSVFLISLIFQNNNKKIWQFFLPKNLKSSQIIR